MDILDRFSKRRKIKAQIDDICAAIDTNARTQEKLLDESVNFDELNNIFAEYLGKTATEDDWNYFKNIFFVMVKGYYALKQLRVSEDMLLDDNLRSNFMQKSGLDFALAAIKNSVVYQNNPITIYLAHISKMLPGDLPPPVHALLTFVGQLHNMQEELKKFTEVQEIE